MQRHAEVLAHMEGTGQQHGRLRRGEQALGHASVALLLHGKHGRDLAVRQQAAMRLANVCLQLFLHRRRGGGRALQGRTRLIDLHDLGPVQVGRQQRIGLAQLVLHQRAIQRPAPARLPSQHSEGIPRCTAGAHLGLYLLDPGLLVGVEHLQQQAALRPLSGQLARQPQLQGVMIGVVVLFADQHPRRLGQALDQLLRGDDLAAGQLDDLPQLGMVAPLGRDGRRRRQYTTRLAGGQQGNEAEQQDAHGESSLVRLLISAVARMQSGAAHPGLHPGYLSAQ